MKPEIQILRQRFSEMEDEQLLRIVKEEASDYRPEAIEVATEEIRRRGLDLSEEVAPVSTEDDEDEPDPGGYDETEAIHPGDPQPTVRESGRYRCPACGRCELRTAVLLGDTQVIAVFEDNHETRFVKVMVCPACWRAEMFVDMETDVQE